MTRSDAHSWRDGDQRGFTLVEVLVAFIIVGLSLTVFLQLLSGSMRLSHKSRELLNQTLRADEIFSQILLQDIRTDDFLWYDEVEPERWKLQIEAIEVAESNLDNEDLNIILPAELYQLTFVFYAADDRPVMTLKSVRQYPLAYFSEDFRQLHLLTIEDREFQ